jgi:hypothetical protein
MRGRATTKATRQRARDTFLVELAQRGNVSAAATIGGMSRDWFYDERAADPDFAAAWDDALETAIDAMELEVRRRAIEGVEKPLIGRVGKDQDGIITYVREYSDSLAALLLKAHRPEKYRERQQIEHSGPQGGAIQFNWGATLAEIAGGSDADTDTPGADTGTEHGAPLG